VPHARAQVGGRIGLDSDNALLAGATTGQAIACSKPLAQKPFSAIGCKWLILQCRFAADCAAQKQMFLGRRTTELRAQPCASGTLIRSSLRPPLLEVNGLSNRSIKAKLVCKHSRAR